MQIPDGFRLDPRSGLYYREEVGTDPATGRPARLVTWLDTQTGQLHPVFYPFEPRQAPPNTASSTATGWWKTTANGADPSRPNQKNGLTLLLIVIIIAVTILPTYRLIRNVIVLGNLSWQVSEETIQEVVPPATPEPVPPQKDPVESQAEEDKTPTGETLNSAYYYENEDSGLAFYANCFTDYSFGLEVDFGGATYSTWGMYQIQDDRMYWTILSPDPTDIDWEGEAVFERVKNGWRLQSPRNIGVLSKGDTITLIQAEQKPDVDQHGDPVPEEGANDAFPYAGHFVCSSEDIPADYRPTLTLNEDYTFSMTLNMGDGMYEAYGDFVWDMQPNRIYLNFSKIGGYAPTQDMETAEVDILDDQTIEFLTTQFGLMGYGDEEGLFSRAY